MKVKWNTARKMVPKPNIKYSKTNKIGIIAFGSSDGATNEAIIKLRKSGLKVNYCRIKSFPFNESIKKFIDKHEKIYVIEQNRDAQMRSLLILDLEVNPSKLFSILHYDGNPIYANLIVRELLDNESIA